MTKIHARIIGAALLLLIVVPGSVGNAGNAEGSGATEGAATLASEPIQKHAQQAQVMELYRAYRQADFPATPDISIAELLKLQQREAVVLVDVREPREMAVSIIPGAISRDRYEQQRADFKDRTVVVYCTIGYRSGLYAKQIRREGINALNLIGGVLMWADAGRTFENQGRESRRVHVYGAKWNLLPPGYEAVYERSWYQFSF